MFVGSERKIPMYKDTLLAKLQETLADHQKTVELANNTWQIAVKDFADDLVDRVSKGDYTNLAFDLPKPVDSSKDINRAIQMVTYSVEEVITLDESTFNQWVLGEWSFRGRLNEIMMSASAMSGALRKK